MQTTTIRIDPPLPCCALVAVHRRCNEMATVAQATQLADGSFHIQPFCPSCVTAMAKNYGVALHDDEKGD